MKFPTFKYLSFLFILIAISACKTQTDVKEDYTLQEEPPFTIVEANFQKWVAGTQEGGSGTEVYIEIADVESGVRVQEVFFRDQKSRARITPPVSTQFKANFKNGSSNDTVMDIDPNKEVGNEPPFKMPFQLGKNQAVLSYTEYGKLKYYKIEQLTELEMIAYPGSSRLDDEN